MVISANKQANVTGIRLLRMSVWVLEAHVEKAAKLFSILMVRKGCRHWPGG